MTDSASFEARVTRAVRKYRRDLIERDHEAQKRFALQLREAHQTLLRELEEARKNVEAARDRGVNENTFRLQRALDMAQQAEALLQQYAQNGTSYIAQQQREVSRTAYQAAQEFLDTTNPPPPGLPNASSFMTFPQEALEVITAATTSGPVYELLNRYGADAAKAAGRLLTQAIVLGTHSDVVAKQLSNELAVPLWKGAQIARTEINRAYQESLRETWRENKHITPKWIWRSGRTASTCAVCWAMDGTEHDVEEPMGSHPSCRCSMVPASVSWDDLAAEFGIEMPAGDFDPPREPTGPEAFAELPEADQRAVLGPGKFRAFKDGEITLSDLVQESNSSDWGLSRREGSLERARRLAANGRISSGGQETSPPGGKSFETSAGGEGAESGLVHANSGGSAQWAMNSGRGGFGSDIDRYDDFEPMVREIAPELLRTLTGINRSLNKGEISRIRRLPSLLANRFLDGQIRDVVLEGARVKHAYREHQYIRLHPEVVVSTLFGPRDVYLDKDYNDARRPIRVVFYRNHAEMDIVVVLEIDRNTTRSPRLITAFASDETWSIKRRKGEALIWHEDERGG